MLTQPQTQTFWDEPKPTALLVLAGFAEPSASLALAAALLAGGGKVGEVAKALAARGFGDRKELYARAAARKARRKTPIKS